MLENFNVVYQSKLRISYGSPVLVLQMCPTEVCGNGNQKTCTKIVNNITIHSNKKLGKSPIFITNTININTVNKSWGQAQ